GDEGYVIPERGRGLRDRNRSRHRSPQAGAVCRRGRRRPLHQSANCARPNAWVDRTRSGRGVREQIYLDASSGQPLTGSFMDYCMPHADQLPSFRDEIVETLSPTNPYGIKAGGEGATTPALAVTFSAMLDALAPLGIRDVPMPA